MFGCLGLGFWAHYKHDMLRLGLLVPYGARLGLLVYLARPNLRLGLLGTVTGVFPVMVTDAAAVVVVNIGMVTVVAAVMITVVMISHCCSCGYDHCSYDQSLL